jgi:hypothetical protein
MRGPHKTQAQFRMYPTPHPRTREVIQVIPLTRAQFPMMDRPPKTAQTILGAMMVSRPTARPQTRSRPTPPQKRTRVRRTPLRHRTPPVPQIARERVAGTMAVRATAVCAPKQRPAIQRGTAPAYPNAKKRNVGATAVAATAAPAVDPRRSARRRASVPVRPFAMTRSAATTAAKEAVVLVRTV